MSIMVTIQTTVGLLSTYIKKHSFLPEVVFAVTSLFSHSSLLTHIFCYFFTIVGSVEFTWRDPCAGSNLENV